MLRLFHTLLILAALGGTGPEAIEANSMLDGGAIIEAPVDSPNIVLIMLDDVGFGDVGTFGGAAQTPVLDRLAATGLKYNRFHTAGLCSPTRASLLSGRNAHRVGWGSVGEAEFPGYNGIWRRSTVSMAEVLRLNGYSTAAFGKWHNTPYREISPVGPFDRWPNRLGFDYFYGNMLGMSSQWQPSLWRNTLPAAAPRVQDGSYHYTADLVDDAIRWVNTQQSLAPDKPYFLYFATGAAHSPHHVPKEWIEKYRDRFDGGWDGLRAETFARQKALGVIPPEAKLTSRPNELPAWASLSIEERSLYAREMEIYAAFISHTDHEIGRLIDIIRAQRRGDNTLILYIVGDNGAAASALAGLEHFSWDKLKIKVPLHQRMKYLDELGGPKYLNQYASGWAWAGNTPFKWAKSTASHFGATRNPLVVSWPARIKGNGELRMQFTHVNDIAPTVYEVCGISMPDTVDGVKQQPLDGVSFAYSFDKAVAPSRHAVQYFETYGNRAIYRDGWVAAARHSVPWLQDSDDDFKNDRWELYDIDHDFSQATDLAEEFPAKLKEMRDLFDREAHSNQVYPLLAKSSYPSAANRSADHEKYIYHAGFSSVPVPLAPSFSGSSFRITADTVISEREVDGVLLALGGRDCGFSFYVKGGRLAYVRNCVGHASTSIIAPEPLPQGHVELQFDYRRNADGSGGIGSLVVNGEPVGAAHLDEVVILSIDNFDVGQDSASPVSDEYVAPFAFSGKLKSVTVELR